MWLEPAGTPGLLCPNELGHFGFSVSTAADVVQLPFSARVPGFVQFGLDGASVTAVLCSKHRGTRERPFLFPNFYEIVPLV